MRDILSLRSGTSIITYSIQIPLYLTIPMDDATLYRILDLLLPSLLESESEPLPDPLEPVVVLAEPAEVPVPPLLP